MREQITRSQRQVTSAAQQVSAATAALQKSRQELSAAQSQLAFTQQQLAEARVKEQETQAKLATAKRELVDAEKEVARGQAEVSAQQATIGQAVRAAYQQRTDLAGIAIMIVGQNSVDIANRLQWNTTIFDSSAAEMDRLQTLQLALEAAQQKKAEAEETATANQQAATEQVTATESLEAQAEAAEANVASLVAENAANETAAKTELAARQAELAQFKEEDARVSKLLADRIAAQQLAAAKRAAAERAAGKQNSPSKSGGVTGPGAASSWGFVYPTNVTRVSSHFGSRVDPINGSIAFHSGTDFPAWCGTPIKAARSGRVTDRYYQSSYGNRLIIDHGAVNGVYLSSAYNHAQSYTVSVGQHVQSGQVIGYIGTTGRSTGCHMHFQIYENGDLANPMRFL